VKLERWLGGEFAQLGSHMSEIEDAERRIAEQRARIIQLEADGLPDDADMAWTMMQELLAEMRSRPEPAKPVSPP